MKRTVCDIMPCPFSRKACTECGIYRGRHRYITFKKYGENSSKDSNEAYFKSMEELLNFWDNQDCLSKERPTIRLILIDAESGEERPCELDKVRTWDWKNPEKMRLINGMIITSFEHLVKILYYKEEKGHHEVKLYEFPRFMLLAGG